MEFDLVVGVREGRHYGERVEVERAVRQHDALGRAGGAAGIEQFGDGRFIDREDVGAGQAIGREEFLIALTDSDPVLDGGARPTEVVDHRGEIGFVDHDAGLGVIEDRGEFGGREAHIERHRDGAGKQRPVVAFEQLVVVEAEIGDAVGGPDPERDEAGGQAFAALAELGVRKAAVARDRRRSSCRRDPWRDRGSGSASGARA